MSNIKDLSFLVSDKKIFKAFPYISLCKSSGHWGGGGGGGHFRFHGYNLNNFGRGPVVEATYHISKTWAFWFRTRKPEYPEKNHINIKSMLNQWALGRGHFGLQGYNLNNFGMGPLD